MPTSSESLVAATNAALAQLVPRAHQMGVRFVELRPGFVRATLPPEGNGNHLGTTYAGATFVLVEVLGGGMHFSSFDAKAFYPVLRNLSIEFVAPARGVLSACTSLTEEELARIRAEAAEKGKARFSLVAEVRAEDGTVVATSRGDYQIRRHGS